MEDVPTFQPLLERSYFSPDLGHSFHVEVKTATSNLSAILIVQVVIHSEYSLKVNKDTWWLMQVCDRKSVLVIFVSGNRG